METLEALNKRLSDNYGLFEDGRPNYRIVWSDDQVEKRFGTFPKYTESGIFLGNTTEVREVLKYPYLAHQFVLEKLMPVPNLNVEELGLRLSYEPLWGFRDRFGNPVKPTWLGIEFLITTIRENSQKHNGVKYPTPELELQTLEAQFERQKLLEEELFGNETPVGDALKWDSAVGYGTRQRNDSL